MGKLGNYCVRPPPGFPLLRQLISHIRYLVQQRIDKLCLGPDTTSPQVIARRSLVVCLVGVRMAPVVRLVEVRLCVGGVQPDVYGTALALLPAQFSPLYGLRTASTVIPRASAASCTVTRVVEGGPVIDWSLPLGASGLPIFMLASGSIHSAS